MGPCNFVSDLSNCHQLYIAKLSAKAKTMFCKLVLVKLFCYYSSCNHYKHPTLEEIWQHNYTALLNYEISLYQFTYIRIIANC